MTTQPAETIAPLEMQTTRLSVQERALIVVQVRHEEYRQAMTRAWQMREPGNRQTWQGIALEHRRVAQSAAFILAGWRVPHSPGVWVGERGTPRAREGGLRPCS